MNSIYIPSYNELLAMTGEQVQRVFGPNMCGLYIQEGAIKSEKKTHITSMRLIKEHCKERKGKFEFLLENSSFEETLKRAPEINNHTFVLYRLRKRAPILGVYIERKSIAPGELQADQFETYFWEFEPRIENAKAVEKYNNQKKSA